MPEPDFKIRNLQWPRYLVAVVSIAVGLFLLSERPAVLKPIVFLGCTNVAGVQHGRVLFPEVEDRAAGGGIAAGFWNRLCKSGYPLNLKFEASNAAGNISLVDFTEYAGYVAGASNIIQFVLPQGTVSLRFVKADSQLQRYWDDVQLPFRPPQPSWEFQVPAEVFTVGQTNGAK